MFCRVGKGLGRGAGLLVLVTGCGGSPTGPSPPPVSGGCRAQTYPGADGGERIQNAINDFTCTTISIDAVSPDGGGVWRVPRALSLRSGIVLEGVGVSAPVLVGGTTDPILRIDAQSDIVIRRLNLQGSRSNAIRIDGSRRILLTQGTVSSSTATGIRIMGAPSSDVTISQMTFQNNGGIDVRTDTIDWNTYHARVSVTTSAMSASVFGVALSNCGTSAATACEVRDNLISPLMDAGGSGIDLNRAHYAVVSGNTISGGGQGMTVDDNTFATITRNTIQGSLAYGILLANGVRPANKPWLITGNQITNNTVTGSRGFGLATYFVRNDPGDRNEFNTWSNNRIEGNVRGGCETNTDRNTFTGNGPQACAPQNRQTAAARRGPR
jgi:parallel beta-helix repeat protein